MNFQFITEFNQNSEEDLSNHCWKKITYLINKNQNSTYVCRHWVNIVTVKYIIFMMNTFEVISWLKQSTNLRI